MSNNISIKQTVNLDLSPEQEDLVTVQILQNIYRNAHDDWRQCKRDEEEGIQGMFFHPDDKKRIKSRLKSSKKLLDYYMYSADLGSFIESVKTGTEYTFNPDPYL
jgi:hypothetical protein